MITTDAWRETLEEWYKRIMAEHERSSSHLFPDTMKVLEEMKEEIMFWKNNTVIDAKGREGEK